MKNQEAKFILSAYRPSGADAGDPMFAEALKQAQQDPNLAAWLSREQAHDASMAKKLAEIKPPAGLREAILAGSRVSGPKTTSRGTLRWIVMGAAAAILVSAATMTWSKWTGGEAGKLAQFAMHDLAHAEHDGHGVEVKALQAKLGDPGTRLTAHLNLPFTALRDTGCRTVAMDGREVFEVCFNRNGTWFHLYAIKEQPTLGTGRKGAVTIAQRDKFSCATWNDTSSGYRYAVVSDAGLDAVKSLL